MVRYFSIEVLFNIADALEVEAGDLINTSTIPNSILTPITKNTP